MSARRHLIGYTILARVHPAPGGTVVTVLDSLSRITAQATLHGPMESLVVSLLVNAATGEQLSRSVEGGPPSTIADPSPKP